jgi:DNA-binding FrmR family transcriptional regulator
MSKKTKSIKQWPAPMQHQPRVEPTPVSVPPIADVEVAAKEVTPSSVPMIETPRKAKAPKVRKDVAVDVTAEPSSEHGHPAERTKVKARLSRVAGQIAGIQKMVDEDRYCMDILTQIAAARAALDRAGLELLTAHIGGCIAGHGAAETHPDAASQSQDELLDEVRKVITRFLG